MTPVAKILDVLTADILERSIYRYGKGTGKKDHEELHRCRDCGNEVIGGSVRIDSRGNKTYLCDACAD